VLPPVVHERHERDRHPEQRGDEAGEAVEHGVRRAVEQPRSRGGPRGGWDS
jgi:hypothetical protein